ncbi:MAG: hypothetical protein JKY54_07370 [Flavobacteriales bacterium]|nr:hypothetical protein [Flavobacteriales bacterium]
MKLILATLFYCILISSCYCQQKLDGCFEQCCAYGGEWQYLELKNGEYRYYSCAPNWNFAQVDSGSYFVQNDSIKFFSLYSDLSFLKNKSGTSIRIGNTQIDGFESSYSLDSIYIMLGTSLALDSLLVETRLIEYCDKESTILDTSFMMINPNLDVVFSIPRNKESSFVLECRSKLFYEVVQFSVKNNNYVELKVIGSPKLYNVANPFYDQVQLDNWDVGPSHIHGDSFKIHNDAFARELDENIYQDYIESQYIFKRINKRKKPFLQCD